jgi:hypothetical protein
MKAYAILQKVNNYDIDEDFSNAWVDSVFFDKDRARARMHECAENLETDAYENIDSDDFETYKRIEDTMAIEEHEDSIIVEYELHDYCRFSFEVLIQEVEVQ